MVGLADRWRGHRGGTVGIDRSRHSRMLDSANARTASRLGDYVY
jgi:hypothetical protein